ncbi:uncharacterized protein LOC135342628 isoform X1 [Halichondria panicea]|uniref:uncharacterized protein LOC135342628 isoform X1 n=2 Tax=Halichondria panicea TaxID=6063 RepID=UPI00312B639C
MDPLKKELWRLRFNWLFILLMVPLCSVSQIGISSSFHQFVTNPNVQQIKNETYKKLEPGLGETETFYSLLIAGFEFGGMVGGFVSGVLVGYVPYWYLWAITFVTHILSYIIYCVVSQGWLIMISRLLAGYILGSLVTLSFAYFSSSSEEYVETQKKLGIKTDEKSVEKTRNMLFVTIAFGYSTGFIIGSGAAVIFAQFEYINQFKAIGWFNVAYGVAALLLLVVMFRGEMKWKRVRVDQCMHCPKEKEGSTIKACGGVGLLPLFIILSLLVLSFTERTRYAVIQTLLNPIASDSFGINERDTSYIFLVLGLLQFGGAISLLIFQCARLSNQGITLVGILTTVTGYLLLTDFQAIPYDPCTEYSPFHHPDITDYYKFLLPNESLRNITSQSMSTSLPKLKSIQFSSNLDVKVGDGPLFHTNFGMTSKFLCHQVQDCLCDLSTPCVHYPLFSDINVKLDSEDLYKCNSSESHMIVCVHLPHNQISQQNSPEISTPEIESITVLPKTLYFIARNSCIEANVTGHQCHWIPSSTITKKECEDCQPICRSVSQTLNFPQFSIGMGLLVYSSSLQLPPIVALITNQSPKHLQGFIIGCMSATIFIMRTVSPLILDALYEKVQKRTFIFTLIMVLAHIPFVIEIIVLYSKLGPRTDLDNEPKYSKLEQEESKLDNVDD